MYFVNNPPQLDDLRAHVAALPWPTFPRQSLLHFGHAEYEQGRADLIRVCLYYEFHLSRAEMTWLSEVAADPAEFTRRQARKLAGLFDRLVRDGAFPMLASRAFVHRGRWSDEQARFFDNLEAARLLAELSAVLGVAAERLWADPLRFETGAMLAADLRRLYLRYYPSGPLPDAAANLQFIPPLAVAPSVWQRLSHRKTAA